VTYDAVVFDYGNTLVSYWTRDQWREVLRRCVDGAARYVSARGRPLPPDDVLLQRVEAERGAGKGEKVRPLEGRLARIFELRLEHWSAADVDALCRAYLEPMWGYGRTPEDVLPALRALRAGGLRTAVLSNLPWGSPWEPWREEMARRGLVGLLDVAAACRLAGWRKPDRRAFAFVLDMLQVEPARALFVGDDPRWDIEGPRRIGMDAVLMDRHGEWPDADAPRVHSLLELVERLLGEGA
jgi:FMN phosphatase YigB (HAD superfamily)